MHKCYHTTKHLGNKEHSPQGNTMKTTIQSVVDAIQPVSQNLRAKGQAHLDNLTKPQGSLGKLEELALQMFLIREGKAPCPDPCRVYTVAADHGVVVEQVSAAPQEVTRQMVLNFLNGGAGINVLAKTANAQLRVVDAGVCGEEFPAHEHLVRNKIAQGTANLAKGPAMTREQCCEAVELGMRLADEAHQEGVQTLGTGEMGIGNTTPSTALYCAFFGLDPQTMAGPGAGAPPAMVAHKAQIIQQGLNANAQAIQSNAPLAILAALGGLEIATLTGLILKGAHNRQLICVDGFIATAAFVCAWRMNPAVADYCVLSHASAEPGHMEAIKAMNMTPLLHLDFRLGEGTGAACAMFLLRAAAAVFNDMATFEQAGVNAK